VGKKNQPSFKIVVTDKKNPPKSGRFVEEVGFYNSRTKEKSLKQERIKYWLKAGAQPSPTIFNLLVTERMKMSEGGDKAIASSTLKKIIEGKKTPLHKKSKKVPAAAPAPETEKPKEVPAEKPAETLKSEPADKPVSS
jgi:small subunit ribosomal protein S16